MLDNNKALVIIGANKLRGQNAFTTEILHEVELALHLRVGAVARLMHTKCKLAF